MRRLSLALVVAITVLVMNGLQRKFSAFISTSQEYARHPGFADVPGFSYVLRARITIG